MTTEIEVKFLNVDFVKLHEILNNKSAELIQPMRLMRRVVLDNGYLREGKDAFLRVRHEGDKVTLTYKQYDSLSVDGAKEIEVEVSDFEKTVDILVQSGLSANSYQETKRETWEYKGCEIVLDEWPWLEPYIEIEGNSEAELKAVASELGFKWENAVFGDVMAAYRNQYPHLRQEDTLGKEPRVVFEAPLPELLKPKKH